MTQPITPLGDRVVAVQEEVQAKTASGLYLPDTAKEKSAAALVIAVGPDVKALKKGDKILFKEYATTNVTIEKQEYLIVREEDILATVK